LGDLRRAEPPPHVAAELYRRMFERRTADELHVLARIKRFIERHSADPGFRHALKTAARPAEIARTYGIDVDPTGIQPLFDAELAPLRDTADVSRWPLLRAWDDFAAELVEVRAAYRDLGGCADANAKFGAWRQRQIRRCNSELGPAAHNILHSVFAFELSSGCTIGCWFCGVSASRFRGNFPYSSANARLWQGILSTARDLLGSAVQTGFCYWATDPADNPDYLEFIKDYHAATGHLPQTTTAAPLRDLAFTRQLLALRAQYPCVVDRFSILNLKTLNAVHAAFSADKLLQVFLVLQNRDSLSGKAAVGRALAREKHPLTPSDREPATIACVSGFLVNLVEQRVRLVSPTRPSERWTLGHIVFGERSFDSPASFGAALEGLMREHMVESPSASQPLGLRPDLDYGRDENGFSLRAPGGSITIGGFPGAARLGEELRHGSRTTGEIEATLVGAGADVFVVADVVRRLFDGGYLDVDAPCPTGLAMSR
jgi:radical SAM family RiPP maturation amino acid epimerase